ncbi:hypothetical protein Bbelb_135230 [Branchiostoma belcheri]|nr:hypothetical protein Bbelb_135230 [Branchiostoma belcheri]
MGQLQPTCKSYRGWRRRTWFGGNQITHRNSSSLAFPILASSGTNAILPTTYRLPEAAIVRYVSRHHMPSAILRAAAHGSLVTYLSLNICAADMVLGTPSQPWTKLFVLTTFLQVSMPQRNYFAVSGYSM